MGLLLGLGLSGHATPALAQVNRFLTRDDSNQVPRNTAKTGNVIPNDDNPDNLPNSAFAVTLVSGPANGTLGLNPDGSYSYTPAANYLGADSFTYQICQPGAAPACSNASTVALNVYDPAVVCTLGTGRNLLQNPSFTLGNTGFTSSYIFVPTPTSTPDLYQEGTYAVASNANPYHVAFSGTGRTGAGDNFMIVNGAAALVAVYSQTVTVLPNRYYSFSVYATSLNPGSPAQLGLVVDGKSTSAVTTLPAAAGTYVQLSDLYFSGPGPAGGFSVTLEIRDVNKIAGGNDFGIDDVYFGSCSAFLLADTKTAAPVPNVPVPAAIFPLSATISAGGSVGVTVASFTVQSLPPTGTLTYNGAAVTVGQVIPVASPGSVSSGGTLTYTPAGGCTGASPTFTYIATDSDGANSSNTATYTIPVVPVAATAIRVRGAVPFCVGGQVRLSAGSRPGYVFTWYNGGAVVNGSGAVLNDSVFVATAAGSYTVKVELAGCSATSPPLSVTTMVCAPPAPCSLGDKFINTWYFGGNAGLDFNSGSAVPLLNSQMNTPEGVATVSNSSGALLFYTNGSNIWNRNHVLMPNGTGLKGNPSSTDGPVAILRPGSTTHYYLFTQDSEGRGEGLTYSEVDMALAGGLGDVVAATKNTLLVKRTTEKLTAVLHTNGCDAWVVAHGWGDPAAGAEPNWPAAEHLGDVFLAFRVTSTGLVSTPVVSRVGTLHAPNISGLAFNGQMKASRDGRQLALAKFNNGPVPANGTVELFDFDASSGVVSNARTLDTGGGSYYGVEFSPDVSKLYATILGAAQLLQFDLSAPNIAASKTLVGTSSAGLGSVQAAPDGKLYVCRQGQGALGVINNPNAAGPACAYVDQGLALGGRTSGLGLPNFIQSFLAQADFTSALTCLAVGFTATTSLTNPDSYAWTFGEAAAGAGNTSALANPTHTYAAAGTYIVTLTVSRGCLCKTVTKTITVLAPVTAGSIGTDQPLCAGATPAPLTSPAGAGGGTGTYAYQWELSLDNTTWAAIPNAIGATYAPGPVAATTYYRRQVTSGTGTCAAATSNVVTLTVLPVVAAGSIAANQSLCANTTPARLTSLTPATGGTGTYAYQWESSLDNTTWRDIPGATGPEYAPGPLAATTYFRRRVASGTGTCAVAHTAEVALTVPPALVAGTVGGNQTVCANTVPAPLSGPPATGGIGTYTYQWQSSLDNTTWVALTGATGLGYAPGLLTATTYYRRQVTSGTGTCATAVSNTVTLTVTPAPAAGITLASPPAQCAGSALTFTPVVTNGGPAPAFRWFVNNVLAAATPTFTTATLADNDQVRVELTPTPGACLTGTPAATVVVRVLAPVAPAVTIRALGAGGPACAGTALSFGLDNATGAGLAPQYQWLLNGVPVLGSTGPTFASAALRDNDRLRLQLTSSASCASPAVVTSNELVIILRPDVLPALSITGPGATCTGTAAAFSVASSTALGTAPAYQWRVDGLDVAGATGAAFSSAALRDGQLVTLAVRTATACGQPATAVSNAVRVAISPVVDVDAGPDKEIVEGGEVVLEGRADGNYPVVWTPTQGLSFAGGNRLRPVASPAATTVYTLSAGASGCEDVSRVTVTVLPAIRIPNAFTPNRDGDDDTWEIDRIGNFAGNTVTVFNRWGGQVFKTTNYGRTNEWGGDINGQPAPVGTYYYVITLGNGKTYSGPLTVVY